MLELLFATSYNLTSFILDSEIVAIDASTGEIQPFQKLAGRARKDVDIKDVQVAVYVYAFDLMYLNGKVSSKYPYLHIHRALKSSSAFTR